ncbi:bHLH transcription factor RHL1 isoform X2 [Tripterygium wilfordii]|uniref:bHLH transcription factor RHL1 isoform X2 n=1 Tax=Tripterygium wilfordii TaxID=458696 RepID=UPI0018F81D9E|nr:bHLH transcription factor RHL1 isoform X2 [Tripterygium wilfordii]
MEGQRSWETPMHFMSLSSGGDVNDVFDASQDDTNHRFVVADGVTENQLNALSLSQWIYDPKAPQNYFDFLAENSICLEEASTTDTLEGIPLPLGGKYAADGDSEIQRELYNHPGRAFDLQSADSPLSMDVWQTKPSPSVHESDNLDGSVDVKHPEHNVYYFQQYNEGEQRKKFASPRNQRQNQTLTSRRQHAKGNESNFSQFLPRETDAVGGGLKLKPHCSLKNQRATITDRLRRLRVAERLKALQDQLPHPAEGSQASVLTEIIDHIKYLQFKLKDLSRSKLGGEPTYARFIFLEGYGHYVLHENMMNEPLEEMMGKLLEADRSMATLLLESRGLYVMPMATAEGSSQAT